MMDAAPVQCVNCGTEQPFERIYCAQCGCSLDAAKPLGQTWMGTFLLILLLCISATFVGFGAILLGWSAFDDVYRAPDGWQFLGVAMWILAAACGWGIWRLARR